MDFSEDKAKQGKFIPNIIYRQVNTDNATGGLLPTIVKGLTPYDPTFMEVAFSLPVCKVEEVSKYAASLGQVKTENGYHILLREPLK